MIPINLLTEHAKGNSAATYVLVCAVRFLETQLESNDPTLRERFGDYLYSCLAKLEEKA